MLITARLPFADQGQGDQGGAHAPHLRVGFGLVPHGPIGGLGRLKQACPGSDRRRPRRRRGGSRWPSRPPLRRPPDRPCRRPRRRGGLARRSSSWLLERTRPTSVAGPGSQLDHRRTSMVVLPIWSLSPLRMAAAAGDLPLVEVRPVGGSEILHVEIAVTPEDPGVQLGHEGVVGDRHPAAAGPPDGDLVAERELLAPVIGRLDHDQPLAAPPPSSGA